MASLWTTQLVLLLTLFAQNEPPLEVRNPLLDDPDLMGAVKRAQGSGFAHQQLLADTLMRILESGPTMKAMDFKAGALAVLRHSDSATTQNLRKLYEYLCQEHVLKEVLSNYENVQKIQTDGLRNDWPRESLIIFPKPSVSEANPAWAVFGTLRGPASLFVVMETDKYPGVESDQLIYTLEIRKLESRFAQADYTVTVIGKSIRVFDNTGAVHKTDDAQDVFVERHGPTVELKIPLMRLEENLRSFAIRGSVALLKNPQSAQQSPWIACSSGPVTPPLEMLIYFGSQIDLPPGNPIPVAIALEEGLLQTRCHPDLRDTIRKDALQWCKQSLDTDARIELLGLTPPSKLPLAALLAVCNRYDGAQSIEYMEQYQFLVPSPQTIAALRKYADGQGWLASATPETIGTKVQTFLGTEFKIFDYPDKEARSSGNEFKDPNESAYIVKGESKFLSYRDVGINDRWSFYKEGLGLKGSSTQQNQIQRLLTLSVGIPTLQASHQKDVTQINHTLCYHGSSQKWFPVGPIAVKPDDPGTFALVWTKPWIRPERFPLGLMQTDTLPSGRFRFLIDADFDEMPAKKLYTALTKGIADSLISRSALPPLEGK